MQRGDNPLTVVVERDQMLSNPCAMDCPLPQSARVDTTLVLCIGISGTRLERTCTYVSTRLRQLMLAGLLRLTIYLVTDGIGGSYSLRCRRSDAICLQKEHGGRGNSVSAVES
jgi:hypothetical protein